MIITKDNPKTLFIAAIIWIAILVLIFYPKNNNTQKTETPSKTTEEQISYNQEKVDISTESFLKNFVERYNTYSTGNSSNIEELYYAMTSEMKEMEMQKIEDRKKDATTNEKEYLTVKSTATEYKEIKKDEEMIAAEIIIEKITFDGAYVSDPESEEGLIIFVDKQGNATDESSYELNARKVGEVFQIVAIRESGEWKIAQIQKASE